MQPSGNITCRVKGENWSGEADYLAGEWCNIRVSKGHRGADDGDVLQWKALHPYLIPCAVHGCKHLKTTCVDCGRLVNEVNFFEGEDGLKRLKIR
jgi:hypothetical protein